MSRGRDSAAQKPAKTAKTRGFPKNAIQDNSNYNVLHQICQVSVIFSALLTSADYSNRRVKRNFIVYY